MGARVAPPEFVAELVRRFGAGHDARFNDLTSRWEVITPSAAGKPIAQVWGWFYRLDANGARVPVPPGPDGLPPYRDLDAAAQAEIIDNMTRSFVGNRHDGARSWSERLRATSQQNAALKAQRLRKRSETFADLIGEVTLNGRWRKEHVRNQGPKLYSLRSAPAQAPVLDISTRSRTLIYTP